MKNVPFDVIIFSLKIVPMQIWSIRDCGVYCDEDNADDDETIEPYCKTQYSILLHRMNQPRPTYTETK